MLRIGVIGITGAWSSVALNEALQAKGVDSELIDMDHTLLDLEKGTVFYRGLDLADFDGFIIKKIGPVYRPQLLDRLEALRVLKNRGLRFFSDPDRVIRNLDRLSGTVTLRNAGIPVPPTCITESKEEAKAVIERYEHAVLKPLYTSKGRGMRVVHSTDDVESALNEYVENGNDIIYIQKMVDIPGKDLGIVFLGGKYLATYARVKAEGSWNTTTRSGGKYEPYEPSDELIGLAQQAQDLFGLDFTSVDVVETAEGPKVFEVSAFGGFRGLKDALGIDAADRYSDYVIEQLKEKV